MRVRGRDLNSPWIAPFLLGVTHWRITALSATRSTGRVAGALSSCPHATASGAALAMLLSCAARDAATCRIALRHARGRRGLRTSASARIQPPRSPCVPPCMWHRTRRRENEQAGEMHAVHSKWRPTNHSKGSRGGTERPTGVGPSRSDVLLSLEIIRAWSFTCLALVVHTKTTQRWTRLAARHLVNCPRNRGLLASWQFTSVTSKLKRWAMTGVLSRLQRRLKRLD